MKKAADGGDENVLPGQVHLSQRKAARNWTIRSSVILRMFLFEPCSGVQLKSRGQR